MKLIRTVWVSVAVAMLGACSILPSTPPLDTYRLPPSQVQLQVSSSGLSLAIPEPYANRLLAHNRLAVVLATNEVQAYEGVRWEDIAPKVFRDRLIEDFLKTNAYKTVMINDEQVNVDRSLRIELQAYQVQYKQNKIYVVIAANATLINRRNGEVKAARYFKAEQEIPSVSLSDIMPAFGVMTDRINSDIIYWTRQQEK